MRYQAFLVMVVLSGLISLTGVVLTVSAETDEERAAAKAKEAQAKIDAARVPLEQARDRAVMMQDIYAATLDVIRHRYFHGDRTIIPARAMEDIFSEMKRQSQAEARWISVNLKAMSIDHEPESEFEKEAARVLSTGKKSFEKVDGGYYRRAAPIPLNAGCISCHGGFARDVSRTPKFAGLVISLPIHADAPPASSATEPAK